MSNLFLGLGISILATFVPLYLGLYLPTLAGSFRTKKDHRQLILLFTGVSSGVMFWFFLDVMNDAALLGVNQGFSGGATHVVLAVLFAFALLLFFGLETVLSTFTRSSQNTSSHPNTSEQISTNSRQLGARAISITFVVSAIIAFGIGFHAVGEGIEIGGILQYTPSIINAIGGLGPAIAYVIHKILEGLVIGTFALLAGVPRKGIRLPALGLIAGIPTIIGLFIGLYSLIDPTYFFALGGAVVVFAEYKLIPRFLEMGDSKYLSVVTVLLGFYLMYLAGLFHG